MKPTKTKTIAQQWKRAELLYVRYRTETSEYRELTHELTGTYDTGALNRRIWQVRHGRRQQAEAHGNQ